MENEHIPHYSHHMRCICGATLDDEGAVSPCPADHARGDRRDAALREIAKGEGGVVTGAAVIARRALATGGDDE